MEGVARPDNGLAGNSAKNHCFRNHVVSARTFRLMVAVLAQPLADLEGGAFGTASNGQCTGKDPPPSSQAQISRLV